FRVLPWTQSATRLQRARYSNALPTTRMRPLRLGGGVARVSGRSATDWAATPDCRTCLARAPRELDQDIRPHSRARRRLAELRTLALESSAHNSRCSQRGKAL